MRCVSLSTLLIFTSIFLVAMDEPPKSKGSSIIALDVFDNDLRTPRSAKRIQRDAKVLALLETQPDSKRPSFKTEEESPLTKSQKLFTEHLRCGSDDKVLSVLKEYPVLQENNSLAKKIWDVYSNTSDGFYLSPQDYEESTVFRDNIVKVSLLLACNGKNKKFLSAYQQKYGTLELFKIIGNANFETMYGALALKAILGAKGYQEYRDRELKAKVLTHISKFEGSCADDEKTDDEIID